MKEQLDKLRSELITLKIKRNNVAIEADYLIRKMNDFDNEIENTKIKLIKLEDDVKTM